MTTAVRFYNRAEKFYQPVALFTKVLTINYARKRKLTILFLFKKYLQEYLRVKSVVTV